MSRRLGLSAFIGLFGAAQLVRPDRTSLPTDASRTIRAHLGTPTELVAVLNSSCGDWASAEQYFRRAQL
jgi:hypothetical protein